MSCFCFLGRVVPPTEATGVGVRCPLVARLRAEFGSRQVLFSRSYTYKRTRMCTTVASTVTLSSFLWGGFSSSTLCTQQFRSLVRIFAEWPTLFLDSRVCAQTS
jgi:hypothetical protein